MVDWPLLLSLLPGRTRDSIGTRARAIEALAHPPKWHPAEDTALRADWGSVGWRKLRDTIRAARAKALGVELTAVPLRSRRAVSRRADDLGLPQGVPQGLVTIAEACRVLGYAHHQLVAVLARHGVAMTYHPTAHQSQHKKTTTRYKRSTLWRVVELDEAREAVLAEQGYETARGAARARGIDPQRLYKILQREGVIEVGRPRRTHFRIPSAVIDAAIAKHAATGPTLVRAAGATGATCRDGRAEAPAAPTSTGTHPDLERRSA